MNISHNFRLKRVTPLEVQLRRAIEAGKIQERYQDTERKHSHETNEQYIERIKQECLKYQFVEVKSASGETKYVAFSTPGSIINQFGEFWLIPGQVVDGQWGKHYFLMYKDLKNSLASENLFVRIDSGCFIGMCLSDNTCDCKQQLDIAMKMAAEKGAGMIIEIPGQDGRGWGEFKMAHQRITNELGINCVDVAEMFYEDKESVDLRTYDEAAMIMCALGFGDKSITLGTNNPKKVKAFTKLGINVAETTSIVSQNMSEIAKKDVLAKAAKWGHDVKL